MDPKLVYQRQNWPSPLEFHLEIQKAIFMLQNLKVMPLVTRS